MDRKTIKLIKGNATWVIGLAFLIGLCFFVYYWDKKRYPNNPDNGNDLYDSGCEFQDGNHSAMVKYYNPETNYSATYYLDVYVENCTVTQIIFPKGGWLDDSHISPTKLNRAGRTTIEDDEGREFTVQIDIEK
jgi:hypothetical protein